MKVVEINNPLMALAEVKGTDIAKQNANPNVDGSGSTVKDGIVVYKLYDELGATGTKIFSGIIDDEYLKEWKDIGKRVDIITRMLKSDATIKAIHLVITLPLESARWSIDIDEDAQDEDREIMDIVDNMIFHEMTIPWQDTLRQILSFLPYGFSVFEKVWARDDKRNIVVLRKLAPRLQKTIKKWFTDDTGGLSGVEQRAYYTTGNKTIYKTVVLPVDKIAVFTYRQDGSDFEGNSILRSAYKHWFIKDKLYLIQAIGLERHALGIPIITLPRGASPDDKEYAKKIVKSWRAHEEAGAVFPEGVKVDNISGPMQSQVLKQAIDHHDAEIAKSVLAQFIQLGTGGQSGSWALSKDQSDFLLMTLNGIAQYVCDRWTEYVIKPFVKMNWGERQFYPKMKCEEIAKSNNMETLQAIQQLASMQIIVPDGKMEEWARRVFNLPAKDEPTFEDYMKQMQGQQTQQVMNNQTDAPPDGQKVAAEAGSAQAPKQGLQAGPPNKGNIKASERRIFDMGASYSLGENDSINNVKTTIQDLIKLRERLVGIGYENPGTDLDGAMENAWNDTINEHIPNIVENMRNTIVDLDSGEQSRMKTLFVDALNISKKQTMDKLKDLISKITSGVPQKLSEPRFSRYKFDSQNDAMSNAVMKGQMEATLGHETAPMINVMLDQHQQADEYQDKQLQPPPGAMHAKAPIYRDSKTGRYKYAKGAQIDGQHVGGQWADIGAGVGVGSTIGILGIGALTKSLNKTFGDEAKKGISVNGTNFFEKMFVPKDTFGNQILTKLGYEFDPIEYRKLYKKQNFEVGHMFETNINSSFGTKLSDTIKNVGGFDPGLPGKTSFYNDLQLYPRLNDLNSNGEAHRVYRTGPGGNTGIEAHPVEILQKDAAGNPIRNTMARTEPYLYEKYKMKIKFGHFNQDTNQFIENEHKTRFWNDYWETLENRHISNPTKSGEIAANKLLWEDHFRNLDSWTRKESSYTSYKTMVDHTNTSHEGRFVSEEVKVYPTSHIHGKSTPPPVKYGLHLYDLIEEKDPFPTMHPEGIKEGSIVRKPIITMLDLFKDHKIEGLEKVVSSSAGDSKLGTEGSKLIKAMKETNGLAKTAVISFCILSLTYLATQVWKNMTKAASRVVQDKIKTSRYDVLAPEQAAQYNAAYEDWRIANSPTGGRVGRPRVNVEIPDELKRGRGRPSFDEAKKEAKRKAAIAKLQQEYSTQGGQPNVYPSQ